VLLAAAAGDTAARAARAQVIRLIADLALGQFPEVSEFASQLRVGQVPVVTDESPLGMLMRRFASPLHWHAVTRPDITPEVRPRLVLDAFEALRMLASAPDEGLTGSYRIRSVAARRAGAHAIADLEEDLGHSPSNPDPPPAPSLMSWPVSAAAPARSACATTGPGPSASTMPKTACSSPSSTRSSPPAAPVPTPAAWMPSLTN
jgi:hypothetical protein